MNWTTVEGDWKKYSVEIKKQFGKLTEQQLHASKGKRELVFADIQKAYSLSKEDCEKQVNTWLTAQKPMHHAM